MIPLDLPKSDNLNIFFGLEKLEVFQAQPFDKLSIEFIAQLSKEILNNPRSKQFPDLVTFGYWCRKSNISKLRNNYDDLANRLGLGLIFHVTPSNVPMNCAFSAIFSILSGNSNVIRVPSKGFEQVVLFLESFKKIADSNKSFRPFLSRNIFVDYASQLDEFTNYFSKISDARVIWGGDESIRKIRSFETKEKAPDIVFPDKVSGSVINLKEISLLSAKDFKRFINNLYNDIYIMDQNACSSPTAIFFLNHDKASEDKIWKELSELAKLKYDLSAHQVISKFTKASELAAQGLLEDKLDHDDYFLYKADLDRIKEKDLSSLKQNSGFLFYKKISMIEDMLPYINDKFQTLTYFGLQRDDILNFLNTSKPSGIDRFCPVGSALEIGLVWDGYDLIRSLSRIIQIS